MFRVNPSLTYTTTHYISPHYISSIQFLQTGHVNSSIPHFFTEERHPWATTWALSSVANVESENSWFGVLPTMEMTSNALELKNISQERSLHTTVSLFYVQSKHFDKQRFYRRSTATFLLSYAALDMLPPVRNYIQIRKPLKMLQ